MEDIPPPPAKPLPITTSASIDTETPSEPALLEEWQVSGDKHGWSDHHQIETEEEGRNQNSITNGPSPQIPQPQPPNLTVAATGPNNRDGSSERSTSDEYLVEPVETEAGPGSTRPTNEEQTPTQTSPNRQTSPSKIARPAPLPLPIHSSSWAPNLHRAAEQTLEAASKQRSSARRAAKHEKLANAPPPIPSCPPWNTTLSSPKTSLYLPSRDLPTSSNFNSTPQHGMGLLYANERAKSLRGTERKCAGMFWELGLSLDIYAQGIGKACRRLEEAQGATTPPAIQNQLQITTHKILNFGRMIQGVGISTKNVSRPLLRHVEAGDNNNSNSSTNTNVWEPYVTARETCAKARQTALKARKGYLKSVKDADSSIQELKKAKAAVEEWKVSSSSGRDDKAGVGASKDSGDEIQEDDVEEETDPSESTPSLSTTSTSMLRLKKKSYASLTKQLSKASERVILSLDAVQKQEELYRTKVSEDNHAVKRCTDLEVRGLESLQLREEERLAFFVNLVELFLQNDLEVLTLTSGSQSLGGTPSSSNSNLSGSAPPQSHPSEDLQGPSSGRSSQSKFFFSRDGGSTPTNTAPKGSSTTPLSIFNKLKTNSNSNTNNNNNPSLENSSSSDDVSNSGENTLTPASKQHETFSSAVDQATSLNFSEEAGGYRDLIRNNLSIRKERIASLRSIAVWGDELAGGSREFMERVQSLLIGEGYSEQPKPPSSTKNAEPLATSMRTIEGKRLLTCWNEVIVTLVTSAMSAARLVSSLQECHRRYLEKLLQNSDKTWKAAVDSEEIRWKQVCDASRAETKAHSKLEAAQRGLLKGVERLESVEELAADGINVGPGVGGGERIRGDENADGKSSNMNPTMRKALGNMFSILPGGGEEAMGKLLSVKARKAIAKTSVGESELKLDKEKRAYENCALIKSQSIEDYTSVAKVIDANFFQQEDEAWSKARSMLDGITGSFVRFRKMRHDGILRSIKVVKENSGPIRVEDIIFWTNKTQEQLLAQRSSSPDKKGNATAADAFVNNEKKLSGIKSFKISVSSSSGGSVDNSGSNDFYLPVRLDMSNDVYKMISFVRGDQIGNSSAKESDSVVTLPEAMSSEESDDTADVEDEIPRSKNATTPGNYDGSFGTVEEVTSLENAPHQRAQSFPLESKKAMRRTSTNNAELMSLAVLVKESANRNSNSADPGTAFTKQKISSIRETDLFVAHFWEGDASEEGKPPPTVVDSFSCAYWPKETEGYISPLLHGRMFVTAQCMYFVGWGGKKIILKWDQVLGVKKDQTLNGLVDNAIRLVCKEEDEEEGEEGHASSYFFGSFLFRDQAHQIISKIVTLAHALDEVTGDSPKKLDSHMRNSMEIITKPVILTVVPPDSALKKMIILVDKKIFGISIQQFYETIWSEGERTDAAPFYEPWLKSQGNYDTSVGKWDYASTSRSDDLFKNEWCGEQYSQKRTITYEFKRTTHLYIGPPTAAVTQNHYCTIEGNDKCVLAMSLSFGGIPYADTFRVEIRWVVRRSGEKDLTVEVGCFVNMIKSNLFSKQVKSGTIQESKPVHEHLFMAVKKACYQLKGSDDSGVDEDILDNTSQNESRMDDRNTPMTEPTSANKPIFLGLALSYIQETLNVGHQTATFVLACIILISAYVVFSLFFRHGVPDPVTNSDETCQMDIQNIAENLNKLNSDMDKIREQLHQVISLIEAKGQQQHQMLPDGQICAEKDCANE